MIIRVSRLFSCVSVCRRLYGSVFGSAHLHSAVDLVVGENYGWGEAAWRALGHFAFTSLFGIYAASVFASTRSVVVTISIHAFCNMVDTTSFSMFCGTSSVAGILSSQIFIYIYCTFFDIFLAGVYSNEEKQTNNRTNKQAMVIK
jgi:hypothetical protein